jgi:hypothetical protein
VPQNKQIMKPAKAKKGSKMDPKNGTKIPPKNAPKTSSTILQFTTIFINFFNFDHFLNFLVHFNFDHFLNFLVHFNFDHFLNFLVHFNFDHFLNFLVHFNFDHFLKLQDDFIGEQGLAALALEKFAEVYEIEGDRQLEVGSLVGGRS